MFARNLKLTKSAPVSTPDTACYGRAPGVRMPLVPRQKITGGTPMPQLSGSARAEDLARKNHAVGESTTSLRARKT
jgi:hypothetical protein